MDLRVPGPLLTRHSCSDDTAAVDDVLEGRPASSVLRDRVGTDESRSTVGRKVVGCPAEPVHAVVLDTALEGLLEPLDVRVPERLAQVL